MIQKGSIVRPIAGKDQDRFFVVIRTEGEWAYLSDGRKRTLSHLKKKKHRHLEVTGQELDLSAVTTNKQLRKALTSLGFCRIVR